MQCFQVRGNSYSYLPIYMNRNLDDNIITRIMTDIPPLNKKKIVALKYDSYFEYK